MSAKIHMNATVLVVMGVAGSGKSTTGRALAEQFGWDFAEGDEMHSAANVAAMAAGHPLTDAQRDPWLARVAAWISAELAAARCGVVTCSALKRRYRDRLRATGVVFVYLEGSEKLLHERLTARRGHFMPATMLTSQLADLEIPSADEGVLNLDSTLTPLEQVQAVRTRLASMRGG